MQLKCIAIDDEPLALKLIKEYVTKTPSLQLLQIFDDAIAAAEFLKNNEVDLLFVDINMPDITGIDLVRSLTKKPLVIFTTAYKKFAYEGFELDAIDYLLKPIDMKRFSKATQKAVDYFRYKHADKTEATSYLFVRSEYRMIKVAVDDIEYIEGLEDYIKIHITNSRPLLTLMTMKGVIEKLPSEKFKRIHRSYIIPINKIKSFLNKNILLTSMIELPVGDTYAASLKEWLNP